LIASLIGTDLGFSASGEDNLLGIGGSKGNHCFCPNTTCAYTGDKYYANCVSGDTQNPEIHGDTCLVIDVPLARWLATSIPFVSALKIAMLDLFC